MKELTKKQRREKRNAEILKNLKANSKKVYISFEGDSEEDLNSELKEGVFKTGPLSESSEPSDTSVSQS